jgi:hypothetical protein
MLFERNMIEAILSALIAMLLKNTLAASKKNESNSSEFFSFLLNYRIEFSQIENEP